MSTSRGTVTIKRTCDICGRYLDAKPGVFRMIKGRWVCNGHDFVPYEVADAVPWKTFNAPAIKNARPFDPRPTYQAAEEALFAFLRDNYNVSLLDTTGGFPAAVAGAFTVRPTQSAWAAAWSGIYFWSLLNEAQRPVAMVSDARAALRACAEWLTLNQECGPWATVDSQHQAHGGVSNSSRQIEWGAYMHDLEFEFDAGGSLQDTGDYHVTVSAAAGVALLRAYQTFGDTRYLDAARACAWFLRTCQCGDLTPTFPSSSDAAGASPKHYGAWAHRIVWCGGQAEASAVSAGATVTYRYSHRYDPSSLLCLRFLTLFLQVAGDETIGSSTTATFDPAAVAYTFTGSRAALVSTCIAEGRAFWETAQQDVTAGAAVLGFSTATPRAAYDAYPQSKPAFRNGAGGWIYSNGTTTGSDVVGQQWALGLRALYEVDGFSAFVTSTFDWLMGFGENAVFQLPATTANRMVSGYDDALVIAGQKGTFSPKTALTTLLKVTTQVNDSAFYDLSTLGLLAPLYSTRQQAAFKESKDALDDPRARTLSSGNARIWLGQMGKCGLSFQPWSAVATRQLSVARAAMTGLVYRYPPQAWLGRGH